MRAARYPDQSGWQLGRGLPVIRSRSAQPGTQRALRCQRARYCLARVRMTRLGGSRSLMLAVTMVLSLVATGCGTGTGAVSEHVAGGRFTVVLSADAVGHAKMTGISLSQLVTGALDHINVLLPGPATTITIDYGGSRLMPLIPQTGTDGFTDPKTGHIMIVFGPTAQASLGKHSGPPGVRGFRVVPVG